MTRDYKAHGGTDKAGPGGTPTDVAPGPKQPEAGATSCRTPSRAFVCPCGTGDPGHAARPVLPERLVGWLHARDGSASPSSSQPFGVWIQASQRRIGKDSRRPLPAVRLRPARQRAFDALPGMRPRNHRQGAQVRQADWTIDGSLLSRQRRRAVSVRSTCSGWRGGSGTPPSRPTGRPAPTPAPTAIATAAQACTGSVASASPRRASTAPDRPSTARCSPASTGSGT